MRVTAVALNKKKRTYQHPKLVIYGGLNDLTKTVASSGMNDAVQGQNNLKTG